MSETVVIPEALAGDRVDRVVALLTGESRSKVADLIAKGSVRCAGDVVHSAHRRVAVGELLEVDRSGVVEDESPLPADDVSFEVVHSDDAIIVVNKPAGLVVHPGAGHRHDTLVSGLIARYPDLIASAALGGGSPERPGIVHRLDKETSGLLVVARTAEAYVDLTGQLQRREMGRIYSSLVGGLVGADQGSIDAPIGRSEKNRTAMAVSATGRAALTHYRVERRFSEPVPASLVEVTLETGRTHQIRVHFAAIGHPVVGDARDKGRRAEVGLARPFLHAERLTLRHPVTKQDLAFEAPLPEDLQAVSERFS